MADADRSNNPSADDKLRAVLQELASGRLLVDEALVQVKRLQPARSANFGASVTTKKSKGGLIIAGLILTLFGGIFGSVGGVFAYKTWRFEKMGHKVDGEVVSMVRDGGKNNGSKPVVKYVVAGKQYEIVGSISSSPPAWKVGEKATVYYNPDDPTDAQLSGFVERWLFPTIFGGIGGVIASVGIVLLFSGIVRKIFGAMSTEALESARFSP
ncbi:MAG: hypothetical protein C0483_16585 [Pirellula sp.]|nr:hypothetical protein [Pirellula sp.]